MEIQSLAHHTRDQKCRWMDGSILVLHIKVGAYTCALMWDNKGHWTSPFLPSPIRCKGCGRRVWDGAARNGSVLNSYHRAHMYKLQAIACNTDSPRSS